MPDAQKGRTGGTCGFSSSRHPYYTTVRVVVNQESALIQPRPSPWSNAGRLEVAVTVAMMGGKIAGVPPWWRLQVIQIL